MKIVFNNKKFAYLLDEKGVAWGLRIIVQTKLMAAINASGEYLPGERGNGQYFIWLAIVEQTRNDLGEW